MKTSNFVIVAHARSGSHMIDSLLNSHPYIRCAGEKFNKLNQEECDLLYPVYTAVAEKPSTISGFKLAYQLRRTKKNDIWSKIINNKQFKVIHWHRSNLLRAYVSREIATLTNTWLGKGEQPSFNEKRIMIDVSECLKWINKTSHLHTLAQYDFRHHICFSVNYENFLFDKNKAIEVLNFLGVDSSYQLSTDFVKQNPEPLNQLITNYEEFSTSFRKTKWANFLDE